MPIYEYRCGTCDTVFDARRPAAEADGRLECPDGHADSVRLLARFATIGRAAPSPGPGGCGAPVAGGCGGACACQN